MNILNIKRIKEYKERKWKNTFKLSGDNIYTEYKILEENFIEKKRM
jgi:hypothetical protein